MTSDSMPSITSVDNPRVKRVRRLRKRRERRTTGLFVAEGAREVTRAVEAGLVVREVYVCETIPGEAQWPVGIGAQSLVVSERVMSRLAYREHPEGVVAVVEQPRWTLEDLLEKRRKSSEIGGYNQGIGGELLLVAVGVAKPGNLGAMARTAEAAGCTGMLVVDAVVDAFNPNAIRASTAGVFTLPIVSQDRRQAIEWLSENGFRVVVADPSQGVDPWRADLRGRVAVVIGAEDRGLEEVWLRDADATVRIPMRGKVADSLNASVSAAVVLFEAVRQRSA